MFTILWLTTPKKYLDACELWKNIIESLQLLPTAAAPIDFSAEPELLSAYDSRQPFGASKTVAKQATYAANTALDALSSRGVYPVELHFGKCEAKFRLTVHMINAETLKTRLLPAAVTEQQNFTLCVMDLEDFNMIKRALSFLPKSLRILILTANDLQITLYNVMQSSGFDFQPKYLNRTNQQFFDELLDLIRASHFLHVFPDIAAIQQYYKQQIQGTFETVLQQLSLRARQEPNGASTKTLQAMLNAMLFASTFDVTKAVSLLHQLESGDHTNTTGQTNMQTERHVTVRATAMGPTLLFVPFPSVSTAASHIAMARPPNPDPDPEFPDWEFV